VIFECDRACSASAEFEECALGRVLFAAKAGPAKAGPAIYWSEIESRFQEIPAPVRAQDRPAETSLPVEPSATLAHDPALADEPPVIRDHPESVSGDPLDMSSPSERVLSLSHHRDIITEITGRNRGSIHRLG
jgi:hypothetical protein